MDCEHRVREHISHNCLFKRQLLYDVKNASSTLERHQCILELKNKQICHDLQVDFPLVGHPLILLYLELFQACLEYFNLVLQFKYVLLQGWYLICLVLNECQQIWNTQ